MLHYVQLFNLWFPQNIINILLHTYNACNQSTMNQLQKEDQKKKKEKKRKSNTNNRRWFWPQTETLVKVLYVEHYFCLSFGYWWCHQQRRHGNWNMVKSSVFVKSTEFWWLLLHDGVHMWGGKGTYLGTRLRLENLLSFF